ncbi:MAG: oligosaccharide flippase family protein [Planctomycetes bacterium]|nr:oligosaccharide flippase family protein [Planctomycetota bacterium]MBI5962790.1 oligosaccharide flippase family protein [Chloroflexota bacterium]
MKILSVKKLHQKPVVRNGAFGLLDFFASSFLTLVVTPILIYKLGVEQFGLWSICNALLGMLGIFNFGLSETIVKYVAEYWSKRDVEGTGGVISAALAMNLGLAILVSLLLFIFSPLMARLFLKEAVTNTQMEQIIRIAIWGFAPMTVRNAMLAVSKGFQDYKIVTLFGVFTNLCLNGLAILIAVIDGSVYKMITSTVIMLWISCFFGILLANNKIRVMQIPVRYLKVKFQYINEIFKFSIFVGLTSVGSVVYSFADRLVVGAVLGLTAVSYYTIAIGVANKFLAISTAVTQALTPAFSAWKQELTLSGISRKLTIAIVVVSVPILALAGLLLIFSRPLMVLWLGESVGLAVLPILRIMVVIYAIASCIVPSYQVANGLGYPWINTIGSLLMGFFTVTLIVILGGKYGLPGAAMANAAIGILFITPVFIYYKLRSE